MRQIKYATLIFSFLAFFYVCANAQNTYIFKQETATYTDLTNDTLQTGINWGSGDTYWLNFLSGETFHLFGESILMNNTDRQVYFSTNGLLVIVNGNVGRMIFDGLFRKLDSIDNHTAISYKEEGTGNNKIVKVQWKNLKIETGQAGNFVNFQIWLYANGIVEYRYGPSSANNASGYIATTGPSIGIAYANPSFSQIKQKIWVKNTPSGLQIDSAKVLLFPNSEAVPANGTVYRFVPKSIAANVGAVSEDRPFKIYPNPATGKVMIEVAGKGNVSIESIEGRLVAEKAFSAKQKTVELSVKEIPAGVYNVILKDEGIRLSQKLVIEN